ncbi:MAG: oxidoreductase [Promethearchaeota archaeon]
MKFLKLFSPLKIRNMTLSNRIVMPAMHLNLADNGYSTKRLEDFYAERAKGGAGLLLVGGIYVSLYGKGVPMMLAIDEDKYVPKLTEFTNAVHAARDDVKVGAQLYHSGRYTFEMVIGEQPIGPSPVYTRFNKSTPREMTLEDIEREQQAFVDAAVRAQKAGFDCFEICTNAGYLIAQFLSPVSNIRKDKYGGSFENRMRFPLEVIEKVKAKIEDDIIFGFRISGDDFIEGSNTYKEYADIAKEYEKAGLDFLNVTGGWHETRVPQLTMDVPEGCYSYLAQNIKENVSIPVFSSNRINDPVVAERILQAGKADAICIGRGLIADPYLPKKTRQGGDGLKDIMYCVACNQGCFDYVFAMKPITCLRNARAANEARTELKPIKGKKKLMVIGAGPAGLESARVAAMRGHEVHIFEKTATLGGLLNIIWIPPGRHEFKRMLENYNYWISKLGIQVHYNTEVTIDTIKEFNPSAVFLATGADPIKPPIPGIDKSHVYHANLALSGDAPIGDNNVVIGGGATGIELAIYLAKYGRLEPDAFEFLTFYKALDVNTALGMLYRGKKKVTVMEMLPKCGSNLGKTTKWVLLGKADKLGVNMLTGVKVTEIGDDYVSFKDAKDNDQVLDDVDAVYYATGVRSNDSLFKEIKALKIPVQKIGDVRKPQTVMQATERAYKMANKI